MSLSRGFLRIRRSVKAFARAPGLACVLLLTIALGVGSNAAVYGFLQGLIHPASAIRVDDRLVSIFGRDRSRNAGPLSQVEYQRLKNNSRLFEWVGSARVGPRVVHSGEHTAIVSVASVTRNLAAVLSLPSSNGAVINSHMWASEFDGRAGAVGSRIRIDGTDFIVTGIAPDRLEGLYSDQAVDLWIPADEKLLDRDNAEKRDLWVVARLRENVSFDLVQEAVGFSIIQFTGLAPNMARGLSRAGLFLSFSAAAVFLVACINVASFL